MAKYVVLTIPLTSAVGQQQPVAMLSARRLLLGVKRPFGSWLNPASDLTEVVLIFLPERSV